MKGSSYLYLHLSVALFGLAGLFGRWLNLAPIQIVQGRTFIAAISFLIVLLISRRFQFHKLRFYRNTAILGLVLAFHWIAFFEAIQKTSIALALLSFASFPFFTLVIEWLLKQEVFRKLDLFLVILSLIGTALIIPWERGESDLAGFIWGLASGLSFAILTILNRRFVKKAKAIDLAFHQDFFAALVLLPFSLFLDWTLNLDDIGLLLLLGTLFTAVSHLLFVTALMKVPAKTAALIAALEPVYGIIAAYFFFAEIPLASSVLGGILILGAGLIAQIRVPT